MNTRRRRILLFIGILTAEFGFPPTVRDIQKACDISSTSVVQGNLNWLEEHELIRRESGVSRSVQLVTKMGLRVVSINETYEDEDAAVVAEALKDQPRDRILEMCREAVS